MISIYIINYGEANRHTLQMLYPSAIFHLNETDKYVNFYVCYIVGFYTYLKFLYLSADLCFQVDSH